MEKERRIICNQIITPDGTRLISHHVHDFVQHEDNNGDIFAADGGKEYLRRMGKGYTEDSIYSDAPFEVIRQHLYRGARGKDGTEPLHYIKLCDMDTDHIEAVIVYNNERGIGESYNTYYKQELEFRKTNGTS